MARMPPTPPPARRASAMLTLAMELLADIAPLRSRAMFGGHVVYAQGLCVALIAGEQLYLKTDAISVPSFDAAGCRPFVYEAPGQSIVMSYWSVPPEALESPALMGCWARLALAAALRAQAVKAVKAARVGKPRKTQLGRVAGSSPSVPKPAARGGGRQS